MTPKPAEGVWTLLGPDGRTWRADSPLRCVALEQRERVPAKVALERIMNAVEEPDFADRHVTLGQIYGAKNCDDLIDKMEAVIDGLQMNLRLANEKR